MRIKAKEENDIFLVRTVIDNKLTNQQNLALNKRKEQKDFQEKENKNRYIFFGINP
jgi:hypothetical protein